MRVREKRTVAFRVFYVFEKATLFEIKTLPFFIGCKYLCFNDNRKNLFLKFYLRLQHANAPLFQRVF